MEIIEYDSKYIDDCKDLLVELEEYIISIDKDNLDNLSNEYRDKMFEYDLEDINKNNGKCYMAVEDNDVIGLIMGKMRSYDEADHLDYKCPKAGVVTELIVSNTIRNNGVGTALLEKMEVYFKNNGCEYVFISVFAYNEIALSFYDKHNYHARMVDNIKKL